MNYNFCILVGLYVVYRQVSIDHSRQASAHRIPVTASELDIPNAYKYLAHSLDSAYHMRCQVVGEEPRLLRYKSIHRGLFYQY